MNKDGPDLAAERVAYRMLRFKFHCKDMLIESGCFDFDAPLLTTAKFHSTQPSDRPE